MSISLKRIIPHFLLLLKKEARSKDYIDGTEHESLVKAGLNEEPFGALSLRRILK